MSFVFPDLKEGPGPSGLVEKPDHEHAHHGTVSRRTKSYLVIVMHIKATSLFCFMLQGRDKATRGSSLGIRILFWYNSMEQVTHTTQIWFGRRIRAGQTDLGGSCDTLSNRRCSFHPLLLSRIKWLAPFLLVWLVFHVLLFKYVYTIFL